MIFSRKWVRTECHALINSYGRNGKCEVSLELLERMKKEWVSRSILTYNTVINSCARGGWVC